MALLSEMTPEQISERLENDTSFGMISDEVASDVIARDSVSAKDYQKKMVQYFLDKEKYGPWLPAENK
jgi:hypothetical protein